MGELESGKPPDEGRAFKEYGEQHRMVWTFCEMEEQLLMQSNPLWLPWRMIQLSTPDTDLLSIYWVKSKWMRLSWTAERFRQEQWPW
jgi:hypothetical protein